MRNFVAAFSVLLLFFAVLSRNSESRTDLRPRIDGSVHTETDSLEATGRGEVIYVTGAGAITASVVVTRLGASVDLYMEASKDSVNWSNLDANGDSVSVTIIYPHNTTSFVCPNAASAGPYFRIYARENTDGLSCIVKWFVGGKTYDR